MIGLTTEHTGFTENHRTTKAPDYAEMSRGEVVRARVQINQHVTPNGQTLFR